MGPLVALLKEGASAMSLGRARTRATTTRTAPIMTFLSSSRSYKALRARRCGSRFLRGGRRPFRGALEGDEASSRDADERGVAVVRVAPVTSEPRTGFNDEATPELPAALPCDCSAVLCVFCSAPGARVESAPGGAQREKSLLTPRFYHTPHGCPRFLTPASSRACDEERAPSQATPPLR